MEQDKEPPLKQEYKDTNEDDTTPTVEEVEIAVQKLRNYKAPGKILDQRNYLSMVEMNYRISRNIRCIGL